MASGVDILRKIDARMNFNPKFPSTPPFRVTVTSKSIPEGWTDPLCTKSRKFDIEVTLVFCSYTIHEGNVLKLTNAIQVLTWCTDTFYGIPNVFITKFCQTAHLVPSSLEL